MEKISGRSEEEEAAASEAVKDEGKEKISIGTRDVTIDRTTWKKAKKVEDWSDIEKARKIILENVNSCKAIITDIGGIRTEFERFDALEILEQGYKYNPAEIQEAERLLKGGKPR